jgi:hypothetical protein
MEANSIVMCITCLDPILFEQDYKVHMVVGIYGSGYEFYVKNIPRSIPKLNDLHPILFYQ